VGDVRPEAGILHPTPAETDMGLITHPISFKEDDPPSILEVFPSSKQGDSTMTICPVCGLSFTGTKKYCSKKCAQVVYNKNYMEKTLKLKDQKKEEHPNNFETTKKVSELVKEDMTHQGEVIKKKIIPKRNKMKSKLFKKNNQKRLQKLIADPEPVEPIDADYPFSPDPEPAETSDSPF
jgi:superfamily II RNA helicase